LVGGGTLLGGRYRLAFRLALGGMGEVWQAHDETLGRTVAVKILKPEYAVDPDFVERFRAEARNTARLSHAGIATVYDYGEVPVEGAPGSTGYLVMELVPGEPLSAMLHDRGGRLMPSETMSIVGQTALALQEAHDCGVIHRDVKPGNLMVTPDGRVKVTDFGIARATDEVPLTAAGTVLGTSCYLAPEQAAGREVTPASDVYSLGIVAYECLAGRRPFSDANPVTVALAHQMEPPPALPATIAPQIAQLVYDALSKSPGDRPDTAGEFGRRALALADPVDAAAVASPTAATTRLEAGFATLPAAPAEPARRPRRTRPVLLPLGGLVVLIAAAALGFLLLGSHSNKAPVTSPRTAPSSPSAAPTTIGPVTAAPTNTAPGTGAPAAAAPGGAPEPSVSAVRGAAPPQAPVTTGSPPSPPSVQNQPPSAVPTPTAPTAPAQNPLPPPAGNGNGNGKTAHGSHG